MKCIMVEIRIKTERNVKNLEKTGKKNVGHFTVSFTVEIYIFLHRH